MCWESVPCDGEFASCSQVTVVLSFINNELLKLANVKMKDFTLHIFKPSRTFLKIDMQPILPFLSEPGSLNICQVFMKYNKEVSLLGGSV